MWNKDRSMVEATCKLPLEDILKEGVSYSSDSLKRRLFNEGIKKSECELCGYTENLELHYINGN